MQSHKYFKLVNLTENGQSLKIYLFIYIKQVSHSWETQYLFCKNTFLKEKAQI